MYILVTKERAIIFMVEIIEQKNRYYISNIYDVPIRDIAVAVQYLLPHIFLA